MTDEKEINDDLTIMNRVSEWYLEGLPRTVANTAESDVFVRAKLSKITRQIMERYYAKKQAKKKPRKPTRARGRYHWKRKEATRLRAAARRWAQNPLGCLIGKGGFWDITPAEWARCLGPVWTRYDPALLQVKRPWGYGTAEKPYTVYNIKVIHATQGVVYDGNSQYLYDLSSP